MKRCAAPCIPTYRSGSAQRQEKQQAVLRPRSCRDAGRTGEQIAADGLFRLPQACARQDLIEAESDSIALSCAVYDRLQRVFSRCCSTAASSFDTVFGGMRAIVENRCFQISLMPVVVFFRRFSGSNICAAPGFIDHVNRLVRAIYDRGCNATIILPRP